MGASSEASDVMTTGAGWETPERTSCARTLMRRDRGSREAVVVAAIASLAFQSCSQVSWCLLFGFQRWMDQVAPTGARD